ncbi:MAG: hypothetical protein K9M57_03385, partial [Phycisphaerae bacterium]|nr:hypothetical protein [Phycisphaerae bacterium]
DLGDNIAIARKISLNITQKAAQEGLVRDLQTVRDVPITILKKSQESDADFDTFCYGFMDNQLILGSSLKYIRQTLMLIDGVAMPQLSNNENFISMNQALGSADLRGYLNVKRLLDVIRNTMPPEGLSPFNRQMATMGIDNIEGVGMTMQLMPERNIQLKSKVLVSIKGEKKGIPALMVPASSPVRPNRMLKKGLASFMTANYDMGTLYDGITKIAWSISGMNPAPMIQGAMMATGGPQGSNPVNFREEFIGQLVKPLTVGVGFEKPYTASDSMKLFMSIGVKDGEVLDKALARIHSTFLAPGQKEMQRELLNSTLYLLPNPFAMMLAAQAGQLSNAQNSFLAMAVVGDQLVFSTDKAVEQTIRDLRRSDIETMATDPMYQYASGYLPEMAGIYFYGNSQISTEKDWVILKEAAKKMAENPNDSDDTMIPLIPFGGSAMMTSLVKEMREIIDFNLLPDFEVVQKYFGPTVGYVSNRDDGIYVEFINLTAPGK